MSRVANLVEREVESTLIDRECKQTQSYGDVKSTLYSRAEYQLYPVSLLDQ
jgi:hypothetical protein